MSAKPSARPAALAIARRDSRRPRCQAAKTTPRATPRRTLEMKVRAASPTAAPTARLRPKARRSGCSGRFRYSRASQAADTTKGIWIMWVSSETHSRRNAEEKASHAVA